MTTFDRALLTAYQSGTAAQQSALRRLHPALIADFGLNPHLMQIEREAARELRFEALIRMNEGAN